MAHTTTRPPLADMFPSPVRPGHDDRSPFLAELAQEHATQVQQLLEQVDRLVHAARENLHVAAVSAARVRIMTALAIVGAMEAHAEGIEVCGAKSRACKKAWAACRAARAEVEALAKLVHLGGADASRDD